MKDWMAKRPWVWIVVTFVLLIAAWTVLIKVALNNQPEVIPLIRAEQGGGGNNGGH